MRWTAAIVWLGLAGVLSACGSSERDAARAQERAYKAQARIAEQRLELVDQYQRCIADVAGDPAQAQTCESYLRAADSLK